MNNEIAKCQTSQALSLPDEIGNVTINEAYEPPGHRNRQARRKVLHAL